MYLGNKLCNNIYNIDESVTLKDEAIMLFNIFNVCQFYPKTYIFHVL